MDNLSFKGLRSRESGCPISQICQGLKLWFGGDITGRTSEWRLRSVQGASGGGWRVVQSMSSQVSLCRSPPSYHCHCHAKATNSLRRLFIIKICASSFYHFYKRDIGVNPIFMRHSSWSNVAIKGTIIHHQWAVYCHICLNGHSGSNLNL